MGQMKNYNELEIQRRLGLFRIARKLEVVHPLIFQESSDEDNARWANGGAIQQLEKDIDSRAMQLIGAEATLQGIANDLKGYGD